MIYGRVCSCLLLLASLALVASSRVIQVPSSTVDDTLVMRLEELYETESIFAIFGGLSKVYKKQAFEIVERRETPFPICTENPPQANFRISGEHPIGNKNYHRGGLIYDFEQIKYPRNLIDIETHANCIYYVREDGLITVATMSDDFSQVTDLKEVPTAEQQIATGNFVLLPQAQNNDQQGYGLFLTQNQTTLFDLKGAEFFNLTNPTSMSGFAKAIPIEGSYLAVALGETGIKIFSIGFADNSLKLEAEFNKESLNLKKVNIRDLAYDSGRKILFMLDYHAGVIPVKLAISPSSLSASLTSSTIKNSQCNVIYYDQAEDSLYLNCRELHKYGISQWPSFNETILPRQDISIRDITSSQNTVALVSRNIFEIITLDRKVAIYEDKLLDKLILRPNLFISGNQRYLITGKYEIIPPSLTCHALDEASVGKHKIVFKVTAECSQSYFDQIGFRSGTFSKGDKCVYTVFHQLKIWRAAALNVKIFAILAALIGAVGIIVLIWWACSYVSLNKLQRYLDNYHSLNDAQEPNSSESGHKPAGVMEMTPVSESQGSKDGRHELNEEVDIPHDLHDIQ